MTKDILVLYGLSLRHGQNINVGPYAWKTEVNLTTLDLTYRLEGRTFAEIRGPFEGETGNPKVTVPTISTGDEFVTDSWAIAEWLEANHATSKRSLFGGSSEGKAFARFLNEWADKELGDEVKLLFAPWLAQSQDAESTSWFLKTKLGGDPEKLKQLIALSQDPEWVDGQAAVVRTRLSLLERQLAANAAAGQGPFLAGTDYPTHADATVYGWYAASEAVRPYDVVGKTWKHKSLPLVTKWIEDVNTATGLEPKYPF